MRSHANMDDVMVDQSSDRTWYRYFTNQSFLFRFYFILLIVLFAFHQHRQQALPSEPREPLSPSALCRSKQQLLIYSKILSIRRVVRTSVNLPVTLIYLRYFSSFHQLTT